MKIALQQEKLMHQQQILTNGTQSATEHINSPTANIHMGVCGCVCAGEGYGCKVLLGPYTIELRYRKVVTRNTNWLIDSCVQTFKWIHENKDHIKIS